MIARTALLWALFATTALAASWPDGGGELPALDAAKGSLVEVRADLCDGRRARWAWRRATRHRRPGQLAAASQRLTDWTETLRLRLETRDTEVLSADDRATRLAARASERVGQGLPGHEATLRTLHDRLIVLTSRATATDGSDGIGAELALVVDALRDRRDAARHLLRGS